MSKEPTAQIVAAVKASPQFARLRVAETEETWISEEDLHTDGSSDEDNCTCKNSPTKDSASRDSSVTLARLARSKGRLGVIRKPSSRSSGESPSGGDDGSCGQSTSKADESLDSASDADDSLSDDEISWKVNREEILMENEMIGIEKYCREYPKICDSMDTIFDDYYKQLKNLEKLDNEVFLEGKEKIKNDLMDKVQFLETTLENVMSKVEQIKKKTQQIQLQNRLTLKEILKRNPTKSAKLAQNTLQFFNLYKGAGISDTQDSCGIEKSRAEEK